MKTWKHFIRLAGLALILWLPGQALAFTVTVVSGPSENFLSWSGPAPLFILLRSTNSNGGPYTQLLAGSETGSTINYTDTNVTDGVEYFYVVEDYSGGPIEDIAGGAGIPLTSGGHYAVINRSSGLALTISNGLAVQEPFLGGDDQLWRVINIQGPNFALLNASNGVVLTGPTASAQLTAGGYTGNSDQQWSFQVAPDGLDFIVTSLASGQVWDVSSSASGDPIGQAAPDGNTSQDWAVVIPGPPLIRSAQIPNDGQLPQAYVTAQINLNSMPTTVIMQFGTNATYTQAMTNVVAGNGYQQLTNIFSYPSINRTTTLHACITASNLMGVVTSGDFTGSSLLFEKKFSSDFNNAELPNYLFPVTGAAAWADMDNDGWLDLTVVGMDTRVSGNGYLYYNPGTNQERWLRSAFVPNGNRPAVEVGDFNNDNRPDFFYACGPAEPIAAVTPVIYGGYVGPETGIQYGQDTKSTDGGMFYTNSSYITGLEICDDSLAIGDFDHTGRQDALLSGFLMVTNDALLGGWDEVGPFDMLCQNNLFGKRNLPMKDPPVNEALLPINTSLPYVGGISGGSDLNSGQSVLVAADFDNDGFPDLFALNFVPDNTWTPYAGVFHGDGNKNFIPASRFQINPGSSGPEFSPIESASCVVADMNGDGYPDLVLSYGYQESGVIAPTTLGIWLNDGHGNLTNSDIVLPQQPQLDNLAVGDIFNHGRNDILMVGCIDPLHSVMQTIVLRNDGNGVFTPIVLGNFGCIGETGHGLQLADYDNDGRLDFAMTGDTDPMGNTQNAGFVPATHIFRNEMDIPSNAPAAAPPDLSTTVGNGTVTFHWGNATDDITPANLLTYNLRVGTNSLGTSVVSPLANVVTGWRKMVGPGNCGHTTNALYRFPPGTYYWSVQAVDGGYKGGAWAPEQTFTITNPEPVALTLSPAVIQPAAGLMWGNPAALLKMLGRLDISTNFYSITSHTLNVSWPTRFKGYTLEESTNLDGPWTTNTAPLGTLNGEWSVLVTPSAQAMFYRLVK